jgi:hypothetical protein
MPSLPKLLLLFLPLMFVTATPPCDVNHVVVQSSNDLCACTATGIFGAVDTGRVGCMAHTGGGFFFCHTSDECADASAAPAFPGTGWRECDPETDNEFVFECSACASGSVSEGGDAVECTPCPAGTYLASSSCVACPASAPASPPGSSAFSACMNLGANVMVASQSTCPERRAARAQQSERESKASARARRAQAGHFPEFAGKPGGQGGCPLTRFALYAR